MTSGAVAARPQPQAGVRVLVVDDLEANRKLLHAVLEPRGFLVSSVASGEEALTVLAESDVDVVLLDVLMPGLDGYSVCRLLKADPELSAIPVILMTTGANVRHRLAGLTLGADEFLSKPIDMRELILRIRIRLGGDTR